MVPQGKLDLGVQDRAAACTGIFQWAPKNLGEGVGKAEFRSHSAFLDMWWWKGDGWRLGKGLAVLGWTLVLLLPAWEIQGVF